MKDNELTVNTSNIDILRSGFVHTAAPSPIIIKIDGGLVQDIEGIPEGVTVLVRDFDTEGCDESDIDGVDDDGNEYAEQVYTQETPQPKGTP